MAEIQLLLQLLLQRLEDGPIRAEVLFFPEVDCLGDTPEEVVPVLAERLARLLADLPPSEIHRRRAPRKLAVEREATPGLGWLLQEDADPADLAAANRLDRVASRGLGGCEVDGSRRSCETSTGRADLRREGEDSREPVSKSEQEQERSGGRRKAALA